MNKRTPPFGKRFNPIPRTGIKVVIGTKAWGFSESHHDPIMVLPDDANPSDFHWPADGKAALIFEWGDYNDERLEAMAEALLKAGASSVIALREALLHDYDPRVFFDAEVIYVAA